ncbi:hypothetical protein LTR27_003085 [Elasticomyces elasticus]|nr:hypothetical protein LTR27_003085 [Elasticomyces elasticus]
MTTMTKRKADSINAATAVPTEQPTKKTRRMKVLSTSKLTEQQCQIYETNKRDSPLLRLPPEVRNRIWSFLLGEKIIHIHGSKRSKDKRRFVHSICKTPERDEEPASIPNHGVYLAHHINCYVPNPGEILPTVSSVLAVLTSCRQIHQEAALLPYKLNTFECVKLEVLGPFLQALVPAQAHAIEMLTISDMSAYSTATFKKLAKTKLRGLRKIRVYVRFHGEAVPAEHDVDPVAQTIMQLRVPALSSASVLTFWWKRGDESSITEDEPRAWAQRVEQALLSSQD